MKKLFATFTVLILTFANTQAQFIRFATSADTGVHAVVTVEGYVDAYYTFDFTQPSDHNRAYFVSYSRHNEVNLNLAYLSLKYNAERVRAVFTPGFGTYMNANYAAERVTLRNIIEANVGIKVFRKRNIWFDMGVLSSPYTNETAVSLDQIMYTRSFASEYVPYYLSGGRLTLPLGKKFTALLYLLNGWQQIEDLNSPLAFGSQLDYKPNNKFEADWDVYAGNERSVTSPHYRTRYFSDLYATWVHRPVTISACAYLGLQEKEDSLKALSNHYWWQANIAARYEFNNGNSLGMRLEHFEDPDQIMITTVTNAGKFDCNSATVGYNVRLNSQAQIRFEARYFWARNDVFYNYDTKQNQNTNLQTTLGITARF